MKFLFLFLSLLILSNCSNDFVIIDKWKNIPIVYGVLSISDEYNYIRVEKAFVDDENGAFKLAQIPDSLYYDNITVKLENEETGDEITLEEVDVNDLGIDREDGVFATSPNILYRFKVADFPLTKDEFVKLKVTQGDSDELLTEAVTSIVGHHEILSPPEPIQFKYDSQFNINWTSDEKQAVFYDVFMRIKYEEQNPDDPSEWDEKELLWTLDKSIERPVSSGNQISPQTSFKMEGRKFYEYLAQNIDGEVTRVRALTGIDIIIDAGGQELFNYIDVGSANSGITSNQIINNYTNMSNGLGIFSSKSKVEGLDYNLGSFSRDSLRDGIITGHLNFQ